MPTATRMIAGLAFAGLGYMIFLTVAVIVTAQNVEGYMMPLCVVVGFFTGWVICGKNTTGLRSGVGNGYTAVAAMAISIVFVMSFITMIERSLRKRYDGPMEAIVDCFALMFENFAKFVTVEMAILLLVGGFVGGSLAGLTAKRFGNG